MSETAGPGGSDDGEQHSQVNPRMTAADDQTESEKDHNQREVADRANGVADGDVPPDAVLALVEGEVVVSQVLLTAAGSAVESVTGTRSG